MTTMTSPTVTNSTLATEAAAQEATFRRVWLLANVWLLFLTFPVLSIVVDDLSTGRKGAALGLIAVFAVIHMVAYRELIRRGLGLRADPETNRGTVWFVLLVSITAAACLVGSWSALAVVPFLVSFAIYHFSWRTALIIGAISLAAVLVIPALGGVLGQVWFFSVIVLSVGGAAGLNRVDSERQEEQGVLLAQLAVSQERDRLARDVHDVLGHSLTVVILKAQVCERLLGSLDHVAPTTERDIDAVLAQTRAQLAEVESVSRRALSEIRATVGGLRSADLADELAAARVVLADAEVELTIVGEASDISPIERPVLAWVVREAVTNIVRHARATQCQIHLSPNQDSSSEQVLIRIVDNGVGLGTSQPGNGLTGLQERVHASGATLQITSANGTDLSVIGMATGAKASLV